MTNLILILLIASTATIGILAGASLDQSFKQLPARLKLGSIAFSRYSKAADLDSGIRFYAILGITAVLLSIATGIAVRLARVAPVAASPIYIGLMLSILHSLTTARAAPLNFSQNKVSEKDEKALSTIHSKFAKWQGIRCFLQVANFGVNLWAMVSFLRAI